MENNREAELKNELNNLSFLKKSAIGWQIYSSSIHLVIFEGKVIFFHSYSNKEVSREKIFEMVPDDIKDWIIWNLDFFR